MTFSDPHNHLGISRSEKIRPNTNTVQAHPTGFRKQKNNTEEKQGMSHTAHVVSFKSLEKSVSRRGDINNVVLAKISSVAETGAVFPVALTVSM